MVDGAHPCTSPTSLLKAIFQISIRRQQENDKLHTERGMDTSEGAEYFPRLGVDIDLESTSVVR